LSATVMKMINVQCSWS